MSIRWTEFPSEFPLADRVEEEASPAPVRLSEVAPGVRRQIRALVAELRTRHAAAWEAHTTSGLALIEPRLRALESAVEVRNAPVGRVLRAIVVLRTWLDAGQPAMDRDVFTTIHDTVSPWDSWRPEAAPEGAPVVEDWLPS